QDAQVGVARGGHHVVLAAAAVLHQRDHLVRAARILRAHLAAGLLLERLAPLRVEVAFPGDEVELALARADLLQHRQVRGGHGLPGHRAAPVLGGAVLGGAAPRAAGAAAAAAPGGQDRRGRDSDRYRHRASAPAGSLPSHVPSPEGIVNACSGRQASRTWWPWLSPSPAEGTSVFCRLTTSSPPPSRSTT